MAELSRYNASEDQAGLKGGILKNHLGITNLKALNDRETLLLRDAYIHFAKLLKKEGLLFDLQLIFDIHKYFLKTLYAWAGKIRSVDISKDGMLFCPAVHIRENLKQFEKILKINTPTKADTKKQAAKKLALIHNEFNVIHPFREGNGRTIRLFLDLLAISLGYKRVDYKKAGHKAYRQACQAGIVADHKKMEEIIFKGLKRGIIKYMI